MSLLGKHQMDETSGEASVEIQLDDTLQRRISCDGDADINFTARRRDSSTAC